MRRHFTLFSFVALTTIVFPRFPVEQASANDNSPNDSVLLCALMNAKSMPRGLEVEGGYPVVGIYGRQGRDIDAIGFIQALPNE